MAKWHFATWRGETGRWIGLAKQGKFVNGHPLYEPGEIWFEFGDSEEQALSNIKRSILN